MPYIGLALGTDISILLFVDGIKAWFFPGDEGGMNVLHKTITKVISCKVERNH